ncbi:MAG TPA: undecaprenyl-diphosphate phosphatase [Terriglobales bacterium]|nr:undecaprenyl-diphosphate phosphatase [Terriglobales bacterium]
MPVYQAVVLAVVQAFGEFLPISSSAHLILTRWFFGWRELDPAMDLTFDVALHAGTLLAVLIYFFPTWINLIIAGFGGRPPMSAGSAGLGNVDDGESSRDRLLLWWIVLGTIPGAIAGKLLDKYAELKFRENYLLIGSMLVVVGLLMWLAERLGGERRTITGIKAVDAIIVGVAQAFALIPGVSRSGSTITAGLARGLNREAAARFSFLLLAPITAGAVLLKTHAVLKAGGLPSGMGTPFALGICLSSVLGLAVIACFLRFLRTHSLNLFVVYRVILGIVVIALALAHFRAA